MGLFVADPKSPIIDFYPKDFRVDMNGKKMSWLGVSILPFIDEERLLEALQVSLTLSLAPSLSR